MSAENNNQTTKKRFLGFTRDDVALGTAGFAAGLDVALGALVPVRQINPLVEGEMVLQQTFALMEKYLPGAQIKK